MGIPFSQIDDAVNLTQNNLIKKGAFVDMQTDLTDHVAVREMWKNRKKKFNGGTDWEIEYQMDHNHSARAVGLYQKDSSSVADTMEKGLIPQRHINAHYLYDLREKSFQKGGHAIVDLIKTKYTGMMVSFYETLEEMLWTKPSDSSDKLTPWGLAYWVTRNAAEGFYGGNPVGFSDRAGIDAEKFPRFRNWTGAYGSVSKDDLIRKMRTAHRKTKFRSPVSHDTPKQGGMQNGIYTNSDVIGLVEEILEAQNMNLGNDVASKDGKACFKSSPLVYVPYLDNDSTDPVYMLDWQWLVIGVLEGWENALSKPAQVPDHHNVRRVDLDASLNLACIDPRRQTVFHKAG